MVHPQLRDHDWLRGQYLDQGLSSTEIGEALGVSAQSVQYQLRQADVKMRGRWSGRWSPKACATCGSEFTPSGPAARFCSTQCQHGVGTCAHCGAEFVNAPNSLNIYCSKRCHYDHKAATGKGRRYVNRNGYVIMVAPPGTPGVTVGNRMPEHRFVMQEHLGRPLLPTETVHHINGDKADNRLENLQLRQGRHGKGSRFVCLDCGSHNVEAASLS